MTKGEDNFVKDQELQIKIQENERLQREVIMISQLFIHWDRGSSNKFNHGILQLYETTQEHKGTILTLQEKLESIERLEDANNQNVLIITEEGLFVARVSEGRGCQQRLTREGGLLERGGFFRQGYYLSKRIHLREGFTRERGLTREGDLFDRGTILVKGPYLRVGLVK